MSEDTDNFNQIDNPHDKTTEKSFENIHNKLKNFTEILGFDYIGHDHLREMNEKADIYTAFSDVGEEIFRRTAKNEGIYQNSELIKDKTPNKVMDKLLKLVDFMYMQNREIALKKQLTEEMKRLSSKEKTASDPYTQLNVRNNLAFTMNKVLEVEGMKEHTSGTIDAAIPYDQFLRTISAHPEFNFQQLQDTEAKDIVMQQFQHQLEKYETATNIDKLQHITEGIHSGLSHQELTELMQRKEEQKGLEEVKIGQTEQLKHQHDIQQIQKQ